MQFSSIPASTACEPAPTATNALFPTCARILRNNIPNFFRLYLSPYVAAVCHALDHYVRTTWPRAEHEQVIFQTFLANSFDEALSGAIKLARYDCNLEQRSPAGLVIDTRDRLGHLARLSLPASQQIEFIPSLTIWNPREIDSQRYGFIILVVSSDEEFKRSSAAISKIVQEQSPLMIICVDRTGLAACRIGAAGARAWQPDIVVFDESFVNHEVPFGAFTAKKELFDNWNQLGKGIFHSTTFQPNTIASMHFLECLADSDPAFSDSIDHELERMRVDGSFCAKRLSELYSPFLVRASRVLGFDAADVRTDGHYILANGRRVFDGVAGVACSIRGHNPDSYLDDLQHQGAVDDVYEVVRARLHERTGLAQMVPAVSGAGAVENALRIGLAAQFPRRYILALKGGFGGKTLLALAGTAKAFYKAGLEPLYEEVVYVDPFDPAFTEKAEALLEKHAVAIVQLELIQAVGGVRMIPEKVVRYFEENKERWGYLLFVDEIQTGMHRTGPFYLSAQLGIKPDLLTLGKGTSDMMFPYALTLYSTEIHKRLDDLGTDLPADIRGKYEYDIGLRTVNNVLEIAETTALEHNVVDAGRLFQQLLGDGLADCKAVRDIRVHGLLIAIELDTKAWPRNWLKKRLSNLYLVSMVRNRKFPLFIGYCQYEPHVLKLTPPLSITPKEVQQVCTTIIKALKQPSYKLLYSTLRALGASALRALVSRPNRSV
jgi:acetylornithine/succinyldiaminopimelate/putrescine aminotransferase